jgi:hypothetical protein
MSSDTTHTHVHAHHNSTHAPKIITDVWPRVDYNYGPVNTGRSQYYRTSLQMSSSRRYGCSCLAVFFTDMFALHTRIKRAKKSRAWAIEGVRERKEICILGERREIISAWLWHTHCVIPKSTLACLCLVEQIQEKFDQLQGNPTHQVLNHIFCKYLCCCRDCNSACVCVSFPYVCHRSYSIPKIFSLVDCTATTYLFYAHRSVQEHWRSNK